MLIWVVKGFLLNAGGPGQMYDFQRFLAARDPRDAAKVGAGFSVFLFVRWGMTAGIALLAVTGVAGIDDPEKAMPIILQDLLPVGIRGLVIAGLLAAFMSTFSSTVNGGASFIVRDLWQPFIRPAATDEEAVRCSYWATLALVAVGLVIGFYGESIDDIWTWIMVALGGGVIIPNFLRWYWWRLNGLGYAFGTFAGMALAVIVPELEFAAELHVSFTIICLGSLVVTVLVSLLTAPVEVDVLGKFYRSVRPFGFWEPVRAAAALTTEEARDSRESFTTAAVNVLLGMIAITGGYLFPMYLVAHSYLPDAEQQQ